jgi:hypothetical protein
MLDLRGLLGSAEDARRRFLLHWGDQQDRAYSAEELQQLGGLLLHTYAAVGLYTIVLDLEDETGMHPNVAAWPVAVFAPQVAGPAWGSVGQALHFQVSRVALQGEGPPCFSWQVRNSGGQAVQQVGWTWAKPCPALTFTPAEPGWYTIVLTIQDAAGNLSKVERSVKVG